METNPTVEPDAPFPSEETTPPAHSAENTPPEPVPAAAAEIAAESAAAEALPVPLPEVEAGAEQPVSPPAGEAEAPVEVAAEPAPSETAEGEEGQPGQNEAEAEAIPQGEAALAGEEGTPTEVSAESAPIPSEAVTTEPQPEPEPEAAPSETESPVSEAMPGEAAEGEVMQDVLSTLADQAQTTRLSPADEERAGTLLKEALLEGRAGVIRAVAALPKLPWVIGVNAVTAVWPELKPAFRTQLLAGLVRTKGDAAKRIRLSLARGLFKQDVPIALKIAAGVSKEMREKETGGISSKHAQIFANVFIGRAKPWIAQLPLAEMKPSDADTLVHCALLSALSLPHAPITQLGVIKWAAELGRLAKVHQTVIDAAHKSLGRWSGKWQNALRKEVADLPEAFASALKSSKGAPEPAPKPETLPGFEAAEPAATAEDSTEAVVVEPDADAEIAEVASEAPLVSADEPDAEPAEVSKAEGAVEQAAGEGPAERQQPKPRPVYESKTVPRKPQQGQPQQQPQQPQQQQPQQQQHPQQGGGKPAASLKEASVPDLLRQLESQFQSLRSELHTSQSKLRQRDEDLRRAQKKASERASAPVIEGEPTPEELARLNRQLESRNEELQARIEELTADSEARAVSVGAVSGEPVSDPNAQLRTLLSLKLQEDYEDFLALEKESPDIVVQQHYRTVLRHVFHVLMQEGVHCAVHPPEGEGVQA
ncbi:hypothetical protein ACXR0O_10300 [Verrucomicrobiota bacterium sgz303538]